MGYSIIDIKEGTSISMPSMTAVSAWWRAKFNPPLFTAIRNELFFQELNITGKDIKPNGELRQFQVQDEFGRPVDIRTWPQQVWKPNRSGCGRAVFSHGSKNHWHRIAGPKMRRQALRALANDPDLGDVEQVIVLDKNWTARKSRDCTCGLASGIRRYWKREHVSPSRCWKDQTKAKRQYAKLLPSPEMLPSKRAGEDFAVIRARLEADRDVFLRAEQDNFLEEAG